MGHKSSLSKFKKIEIISSIFSDHNAIRLDMKKTLQEVRQEKKAANKECLLSNSLHGLLNIILLGNPESHHKTHASELSYLRRERV